MRLRDNGCRDSEPLRARDGSGTGFIADNQDYAYFFGVLEILDDILAVGASAGDEYRNVHHILSIMLIFRRQLLYIDILLRERYFYSIVIESLVDALVGLGDISEALLHEHELLDA